MRKQRRSLGNIRRMNRMRRICVAVPLAWMSVVMPALARCTADLSFYNEVRRAHGQINVECPGIHSYPFGNWGVDSAHGTREDGNQFSGWKPQNDGTHEWNSCTRVANSSDFQPGAVIPAQWADPDIPFVYATARYKGPRGRTCESWLPGRVFTIAGEYMKVYELDPLSLFFGSDDWVATLLYGTINIPLTCTGPWYCTGRSQTYHPYSGTSKITAGINVFVRLYRR